MLLGVGAVGIMLGLKNMTPCLLKLKTLFHVMQWIFWVLIPIAIGVLYGWLAADISGLTVFTGWEYKEGQYNYV